jgi:hypothetical protein
VLYFCRLVCVAVAVWDNDRMRRSGLVVVAAAVVALVCWGGGAAVASTRLVCSQVRHPASTSFGPGPVGSLREAPVCIRGAVTISFVGSRAAGCASLGVCRYSGTISWHPGRGELFTAIQGPRGRRHQIASFLPTGAGASGRRRASIVTRRVGPDGVRGECRESPLPGGSLDSATDVGDGQISIQLPPAGVDIWATRCAGPLARDLPALPVIDLLLRDVLAGHATATIDQTHAFSRGGFAGEITTDLHVLTGRAVKIHPESSESRTVATPSASAEREVTANFALRTAAGALTASWSHSAAGCTQLDACGLRGTSRITFPRSAGTLSLTASGPASRPDRDFLTALGLSHRGNANGISINALGSIGTRDINSEQTIQDGSRCRDSTPLQGAILQGETGSDSQQPAGFTLSYQPRGSVAHRFSAGDPLRTSCPGPELGHHVAARVPIAPFALAGRTPTIRVSHPVSFNDHGYAVHFPAGLTLRLTRTSIRYGDQPFAQANAPRGGFTGQRPGPSFQRWLGDQSWWATRVATYRRQDHTPQASRSTPARSRRPTARIRDGGQPDA